MLGIGVGWWVVAGVCMIFSGFVFRRGFYQCRYLTGTLDKIKYAAPLAVISFFLAMLVCIGIYVLSLLLLAGRVAQRAAVREFQNRSLSPVDQLALQEEQQILHWINDFWWFAIIMGTLCFLVVVFDLFSKTETGKKFKDFCKTACYFLFYGLGFSGALYFFLVPIAYHFKHPALPASIDIVDQIRPTVTHADFVIHKPTVPTTSPGFSLYGRPPMFDLSSLHLSPLTYWIAGIGAVGLIIQEAIHRVLARQISRIYWILLTAYFLGSSIWCDATGAALYKFVLAAAVGVLMVTVGFRGARDILSGLLTSMSLFGMFCVNVLRSCTHLWLRVARVFHNLVDWIAGVYETLILNPLQEFKLWWLRVMKNWEDESRRKVEEQAKKLEEEEAARRRGP